MGIFQPGQEITYARTLVSGESIVPMGLDIAYGVNSELDYDDMHYLRLVQPFIGIGDQLRIVLPNHTFQQTSKIQEVRYHSHRLVYLTKNSIYEVRYQNINLERILNDGPNKGVNAHQEGELPLFPQ